MNQSISEEWEKLFEGHCICDKYAPQEDIGCIIHGEDGIKAKKFIQSKISQSITAERKENEKLKELLELQTKCRDEDIKELLKLKAELIEDEKQRVRTATIRECIEALPTNCLHCANDAIPNLEALIKE